MFFTTPALASPAAVTPAFHPLRRLSEPSREAPINPSIVVIVVILTIIFFLSGCLHLLIRCIVRSPRRDPNSIVTLTALQGQLQQLFHLHDSGVEQAFIDTLPVFFYKSVKGLKEGADCAVCLCEFQADDRLRLLPKCSHAFHLDCIDTWLLSHSTCPLCRRSLLPEEPPAAVVPAGAGSHRPLSLDASSQSSDGGDDATAGDSHLRGEEAQVDAAMVSGADAGFNAAGRDNHGVLDVIKRSRDRDNEPVSAAGAGASVAFPQEHPQSQYAGKVLTVQLGRFKVVDHVGGGGGGSETKNINGSRRSYSVGSYEYVLDPCSLEVVIAPTPLNRRSSTPRRPKAPGHRTTLSECTAEDVMSSAAYAAPAADVGTPFHEDLAFFRRAGSSGSHDKPLRHARRASEAAELELELGRRRHAESYVDDEAWVSIDLSVDDDHGRNLQQPPAMPPSSSHGCNSFAPSSTHSDRRRAQSFRHPLSSDSVKLKASASRRSLSETELPHCDWAAEPASFSGAQLVTPSTQLSNYDVPRAGGPSLAKRTINWLVGKQQKWIGLSFLHDNVLLHR